MCGSNIWGGIGSLAGSILGNMILPGAGSWIGGSIGGSLGESLGGGTTGQDLAAGALGGLAGWGGSQLLGGGSTGSLTGGNIGNALTSGAGMTGGGNTLDTVLGTTAAGGTSPMSSLVPDVQGLGGMGVMSTGSSMIGPAATAAAGSASSGGLSGILGDVGNWVKSNPGTASQLGFAALMGNRNQSLPPALQQLQGISSQDLGLAQGIIKSGGTSAPNWQQQKTSIDASINQQIQQAQEQILQAAANSGMGANSLVVKEQIAQMQQNANVQRQQLYQQALNQNVSEAMNLLGGGEQSLALIGNTQYQQDQQAQQIMALLAGNAMQNYTLGQQKSKNA